MDDKFFDKKIKTALDHIEAPYDAGSWAALEQRLNAPFAEEHPAPVAAVDKAVLRTLERLEAPYQPAHWDVLAGRMTQIARLRKKIWVAKLSEAAIFLLLLANLDGFFGAGTSEPQQPVTPKPPVNNRLQAEAPALRVRPGTASGLGSTNENIAWNDGANWAGFSPLLLQDAGNQDLEEIIVPYLYEQKGVNVPENLLEPASADWVSLTNLSPLPTLPGQPATRVNTSPYAGSLVHVKAPKQHRFYAATFANFDKNHVRSEDHSHNSNGYGGGMAIGYRIGKWGVEAGLSYNRKQYQPKKEIEIYGGSTVNGFYASFAKSVDADMVSVPVKITRRIAQIGPMSAHAVAGVTTHIALDKSFQYGSTFYPGQGPPNATADPNQQPQLRKTGKGVLENGSINGNVYASADAGVRLEYPVSRRLVAFVEPAYRHAIGQKGIGPKPSRINTFSLQAGVLTTL